MVDVRIAMGSECKCSFYKHGQAQSLGHLMSFKAVIVSLLVLGLQAKAKGMPSCASDLACLY